LEQSAINFALQIAANAPLAVEATRVTLRADIANRVQSATSYEAEVQSRLKKTEDFAEGVQAVAQRRPGQFKRR
jgi:enoyl-CoA hydratase/carnithine racemase